jgi:phosphoribosylanthranilate isomerase
LSIGVKICGIKTPAHLDAAIAAGASHCGLVFFPPSPRNVSLEAAADLAAHARSRVTVVVLMVDAADDFIRAVAGQVAPDMLQLHGSETPERIKQIRTLSGLPVIKAVPVATKEDVLAARAYDGVADLILFDAKTPSVQVDALPGGNGLSFDWSVLAPVKGRMRFALSGGLTPDNVAEAIAATQPKLVDVSSGVESAPGVKDAALIRRFIAAARTPALEGAAHV